PCRSKNPLERQTKGEFDLVIALHDDGDRGNGIAVHTGAPGVDRQRRPRAPRPASAVTGAGTAAVHATASCTHRAGSSAVSGWPAPAAATAAWCPRWAARSAGPAAATPPVARRPDA